ncbi:MAG: gamma-glutamyltransferase [Bacteroidota bacterium]
MVVSAKQDASKIGIEILKNGGNAFDAMIATDLALAVVYPNAGNLGGGGFMVYRLANGAKGSLDYREKAPLKSSKNMYLDENSNIVKGLSIKGGLSVAVPGTVAGLFEIHEKFGSLPFSQLIQPSIDLAEQGYVISKKQANTLNQFQNEIYELNDSIKLFDSKFKEGDIFVNKSLSKTLKKIQSEGKDAFYDGELTSIMIDYLNKKGGILTYDDFKLYEPIWRDPLIFNYKDLKIISMGPPSSGGIVLGQILRTIEDVDLSKIKHNSTEYIQLLVEAEKLSFADRSKYLGDPDFNTIPISNLLNKNYLKDRFSDFKFENATKSSNIRPGSFFKESIETTHYSIVDKHGNAVSVTTTLNGNYGSKLISDELGFFFNNEMDDFSIKPGYPNMYGLVGGEINSIEPEKRMLSSMTPTIVEQNGKLSLILGSPGGPTIITSVLQTILNFYEYGFDIQKSVDLPRFHHIWLPDKIFYEDKIMTNKTKEELINKDYILNSTHSSIGRVDAIHVDNNNFFHPAADKRGDDASSAY